MDGAPLKTRAVLVRRNGALGLGALIATATVIGIGGTFSSLPPTREGPLAMVFALGWPLALALWAAFITYARPWRSQALVEVADGALLVNGRVRRSAGTVSRGDATVLDDSRVRIELRSRLRPRVRLEVSDASAARELLAGLGLDRRTGTTQFRIRRLRRYETMLVLAAVFFLVPLAFALSLVNGWLGLVAFVSVVLSPIIGRILARVGLTVGNDGLDLRSPLGHVFVPHARIRAITPVWPEGHERGSTHEGELVSWGFEVLVDDGTKHRLDTRPERFSAGVFKTDPVFGSAFAAWESARRSAAASDLSHASALLARGGKSTREWIASLRELAAEGAGGYRVAALDDDALFAIFKDPGAARELRAGAAVAIGIRQEHAPRLRVAADDVADPIVRRVAVACAESDPDRAALLEAELDEALRVSTAGPAPKATLARR